VDFDCSGPDETKGHGHFSLGEMNFLSFSVRVSLTLAFDEQNSRIDVLNWVPGITRDDDQLDKFIHVNVVTSHASDPGGAFQEVGKDAVDYYVR
jgi:hypothetical protein